MVVSAGMASPHSPPAAAGAVAAENRAIAAVVAQACVGTGAPHGCVCVFVCVTNARPALCMFVCAVEMCVRVRHSC